MSNFWEGFEKRANIAGMLGQGMKNIIGNTGVQKNLKAFRQGAQNLTRHPGVQQGANALRQGARNVVANPTVQKGLRALGDVTGVSKINTGLKSMDTPSRNLMVSGAKRLAGTAAGATVGLYAANKMLRSNPQKQQNTYQ